MSALPFSALPYRGVGLVDYKRNMTIPTPLSVWFYTGYTETLPKPAKAM